MTRYKEWIYIYNNITYFKKYPSNKLCMYDLFLKKEEEEEEYISL
jgi:hypothetical protein